MGCAQAKQAAGTKDGSKSLSHGSGAPLGAPSNLSRLSHYIPTTGPLSSQDYWSRLEYGATESVQLKEGLRVKYAFVTQRGYYPEAPDKANQDAVYVKKDFGGTPGQMFFGVFDGHGIRGEEAAQFAKTKVPENLSEHARLKDDQEVAFRDAMVLTNRQLHDSTVDDSMSGTTAISCLIRGRTAYIANVGDSRAVIAECGPDGKTLTPHPLSRDQTPFRRDECERVKKAGARVLTLDQVEGLKDPEVECWKNEEEDSGDPPRLWAPNAMYPGTAFTRSIGDALAEEIGVSAEPEVEIRHISADNPFMVIASDGVFEFLSNQDVVNMVSQHEDPQEAAIALVVESYHLWLSYETRTDDITAIVVMLETVDPESPPATVQMKKSKSKAALKNNNRSFVGSLKKSFSQAYSPMDDEVDRDPLVVSGSSSRYFSEEDLLEKMPTPKRVLERQESRSRHPVTNGAVARSGSPKMSMPPTVMDFAPGGVAPKTTEF